MLSLIENKYWIWISRLPGIGTKTLKKLLSKYGSLNEKRYFISNESTLMGKSLYVVLT